ncbi:MAG: AAA family ATPase [Firmicutes bacterium]|nr:AAA family ATPase [Bacillota bacterium]
MMIYKKSASVELKPKLSTAINKDIIAFANGKGGTVIIGIQAKGPVTGVRDPAKVIDQIQKLVYSIKPAVSDLISYDIETVTGKKIVKIDVSKGTNSPYFLAEKGLCPAGVFIRKGSASAAAPNNVIRRLIKQTDGNVYEQMRSLNQNLTFEITTARFASHQISWNKSLMKTLKLLTEDDIYTNLGLLLSDQCEHTIKVAAFAGKTKSIFKHRREFGGPLVQQFETALAYLGTLDQTSDKFAGVTPVASRDYPREALREALLNAVVHRDYSYNSSTLISIFDDRAEFVSMGGLPRGINAKDIMLGISHSRNERLQHIFSRLGLAEAHGTGMQKIMASYQDSPIQPEVKISGNAFLLILPNINAEAISQTFSADEQAVLELLDQQEAVTLQDVSARLDQTAPAAGKIMRQLIRKDVLKVKGHGVDTKYVLKK